MIYLCWPALDYYYLNYKQGHSDRTNMISTSRRNYFQVERVQRLTETVDTRTR